MGDVPHKEPVEEIRGSEVSHRNQRGKRKGAREHAQSDRA
jgi:hypothetical protein